MTGDFEAELERDDRFERRLFWRELAILVTVAGVVALLVALG
jgi:hypothetical protein